MVIFFKKGANLVFAVESDHKFSDSEKEKLFKKYFIEKADEVKLKEFKEKWLISPYCEN